MTLSDEFVTLARVVKTQGRKGEVAAEIYTDFPERFEQRRRLSALLKDGGRRTLQLENHWFHKGQIILKFVGVDSISAAEALLGSEIQVPIAQRAILEPGTYYISDLKDCVVFDSSVGTLKEIGKVVDVDRSSGEAPNLLVRSGDKEFYVPLVEQYIRIVDIAAKRLEMDLPEGLLEVDAPLTAEEKRQLKKPLKTVR